LQIQVLIDAFAETSTGGSEILSYIISWNGGSGNVFTDISGHDVNDLSLDRIFVAGINSGVYYDFKYRAKNIHGEGEPSDPFTILAAHIPVINLAPVVSLDANVMYRIAFVEPNTGGDGVPISAYEILVLNSQ
jgi:hypothetical protein